MLGVCYGHQLIADVLGGCVGLNPAGREIGVCDVTQMDDDPIFEGLPKEIRSDSNSCRYGHSSTPNRPRNCEERYGGQSGHGHRTM